MYKDNPYWEEFVDSDGRRGIRRIEDDYRQYALDLVIANRIKELCLGLNGCLKHTDRALAIAVTGLECQYTGQELRKSAAFTLNEDWDY